MAGLLVGESCGHGALSGRGGDPGAGEDRRRAGSGLGWPAGRGAAPGPCAPGHDQRRGRAGAPPPAAGPGFPAGSTGGGVRRLCLRPPGSPRHPALPGLCLFKLDDASGLRLPGRRRPCGLFRSPRPGGHPAQPCAAPGGSRALYPGRGQYHGIHGARQSHGRPGRRRESRDFHRAAARPGCRRVERHDRPHRDPRVRR